MECTIRSVNVILPESNSNNNNSNSNNKKKNGQRSFMKSLGELFYTLFTRQESCPDWLSKIYDDGKQDNSPAEEDDSDFEASMLKVLSVFENQQSHRHHEELLPSTRPKQQRHSESNTFSKVRNNNEHQQSTLPVAVCRLVSDLIDSSSSSECTMPTKTAFASLNDVLDDLKQMVIEPETFLHDSQTVNGRLDFGTKLYGRKGEISQILSAAERISYNSGDKGPLEMISISGYSGSGKSALVRQVGCYLSKNGWFFLQGKFDRMRRNDALSVVTSAFENYCLAIQEMKARGNQDDLEYCSQVSAAAMKTLGQSGADYLSFLIPTLSNLVQRENSEPSLAGYSGDEGGLAF